MATLKFVQLKDMTALEAFALFRLRVDVFVAEQGCSFKELDDADAAEDTFHLLAVDSNGHLAGCARVFPTDTGSRFGRFVVAPEARGTGLGPEIVAACIEFTKQWPGDLVIDAQAGLKEYYSRFGFVAEGEEFLDTGIPHVVMRIRR